MNLFKRKKESKLPVIGLVLAFIPILAFLLMSLYHSYIPYWLYQGIDKNVTALLIILVLISILSLAFSIKGLSNKLDRLISFVSITLNSITITFNSLLIYLLNAKNLNFNNYSFLYKLSNIINKGSVSITSCLSLFLLLLGAYGIFKKSNKAYSLIMYIAGVILACLSFVGVLFILLVMGWN